MPLFCTWITNETIIADFKKGYKNLTMKVHPDEDQGTKKIKKKSKIEFQNISNAHQLISDKHWNFLTMLMQIIITTCNIPMMFGQL